MTWLQIDVLELLVESARERLLGMHRPARSVAFSLKEARAALAAERHLEAIRLPHPLSAWGMRTFNLL